MEGEKLTISVAPKVFGALFHRAIQIGYANDVNSLIKQKIISRQQQTHLVYYQVLLKV